ncbi:hypothetical protein GCM10010260_50890 [Streptomyces filipinensis]|uniref:Glucose-methanol-choline oxidoreductase N-terminal domain-containing protein n=1 Tax=Streptomyces filipinensis TaxID=66887 RepID=A0A918IE12_9ACTN|nr:GMC family oxidoreductase N-terminal domain-containing protein [Streptomyces filipinensis]GGV07071.1 hypothetical protein GCM10010260_50890 [Streptomyces filipinensis]
MLSSARAHRVVIEGGRARGVEVERGGIVEVVHAEREVILSAGAHESEAAGAARGRAPTLP